MTRRHNHLLIAGTGRAGTSFLVRYLTAVGLDTTLSRHGHAASWDKDANAGLEDLPLTGDPASWPYVIKTAWLHQFVDQVLANGSMGIDAVIVPVRSLREAAASRVILELRAIHAAQPWMADCQSPWNAWGCTAGGCIIPLEPLDQARLLAMGFYHLIERLVSEEVPLVFVAFPRLVQDSDYLFAKLTPFLPGVSADQAREAHTHLADPSMLRVGNELQASAVRSDAPTPDVGSDLATLNHVALRRELSRLRAELRTAEERASEAIADVTQARQEVASLEQRNDELSAETMRLKAEVNQLRTDLATAVLEEATLRQAADKAVAALEHVTARSFEQKARADEQKARADMLATLVVEREAYVTAMLGSTSWRLTRPLRAIAISGRRLIWRKL